MKYKIAHTTKYQYSNAVPVCHNLVHLAPRALKHQTCSEYHLVVHPEPREIVQRFDYFQNQVSYFSIEQAHRGLTVAATSHVEVREPAESSPSESPAWEAIAHRLQHEDSKDTLEAYEFVPASKLTQPIDGLVDFVKPSFTPNRPIGEAMVDLTARIHDEFQYDPRATTIHTPIRDVFDNRHGVCQDFAHLQIACLRILGLAARYVSGYLRTTPPPGKQRLVGVDASHAWLSVYCGELGWVDIDPTNNVLTSTDHITVAWGRDYHDVCPIQGVILGGGEHKMTVSVDVAPD